MILIGLLNQFLSLLFSYAKDSFQMLSFDFFQYSRSDCEIPRNDDDWEFFCVFELEGVMETLFPVLILLLGLRLGELCGLRVGCWKACLEWVIIWEVEITWRRGLGERF
jgi:hypothetical protein